MKIGDRVLTDKGYGVLLSGNNIGIASDVFSRTEVKIIKLIKTKDQAEQESSDRFVAACIAIGKS